MNVFVTEMKTISYHTVFIHIILYIFLTVTTIEFYIYVICNSTANIFRKCI